ncbi:MAG: UDP-N-acetylglucosamine 2-epimerase (non-hydrolyzing) [Ruminococcaceae bacterium]|nr:UDP-N-acetylglucosamine 2-epimerase (non-hydrolyzing) [Oscillospiraceae bacterium]
MASRYKVMTVIGTRPEIIRLSEVMKRLDIYFNHVIVHTGQNYDYTLNQIFFEELGLREPDIYLDAAGANLGETMGNILKKSYETMQSEAPDAVLILGDTNSALSAISAKRLKIPVFHMEAGNRCFDENVPEEINRRIVDHISDINLPYTEHSRRYLIGEGIKPQRVFVTGSPLREVISKNIRRIRTSDVIERMGLTPGGYILVSAHREENVDIEENFYSLMKAINTVADYYDMPVIYSTHPRSLKRINERGFEFSDNVRNHEPFGFFDYNKLQMNAFCVLSDSGTLSEESAMLAFPGVLIRTSTERPEALDAGTVVIGGITENDILSAIKIATEMYVNDEPVSEVSDYLDANVSQKVVKIIESYIKIINREVWRKN